jgi:TetR/AcrR family transcriptional regulator
LIAAMAEVCAERSYAESSVAEIVKHAGVSTASFYRQFNDRRECMLASFEELFERLLVAVGELCAAESNPERRKVTAIRGVAEILAGDAPTARLLTIEVAAVGSHGVLLQQLAIDRLAELLGGAGDEVAPSSEWVAVSAMVALVGRRVVEGNSAGAGELEAIFAAVLS